MPLDNRCAIEIAGPWDPDEAAGGALAMLAEYFRDNEHTYFVPMKWVEFGPLWLLRLRKTEGTVLGDMAEKLRSAGYAVGTTTGDLMDTLGIDRYDLHMLACVCNGDRVIGAAVSSQLNLIGNNRYVGHCRIRR